MPGSELNPPPVEPLSGKLEEHSLSEVLRRLEAGRHDGTLRLARGAVRARIDLAGGRPVAARAPGIKRLGDLLVAAGLCDPITVREAARLQAEEQGRRPLGEILISHGVLARSDLERLIAQQVSQALTELGTWKSGRFSFEPQVAPQPRAVRDSGTRATASAATRRDPSRHKTARQAAASPAPAALAEGRAEPLPEPLILAVRTRDEALFETLALVVPPDVATVVRAQAALASPQNGNLRHRDTWLVADLRSAPRVAAALESVLDPQRPMPVIVVLDPGANSAAAYLAGALAVVPADAEVIAAAVANLAALLPGRRGTQSDERVPQRAAVASLGAELDPVTGSTTVALDLMQAISPFVERAVLFLVAGERLTVAGAFGAGADGQLLVSLTRGLKLELSGESALVASLDASRPVSLDFEAAHLPRKLARLLGAPATGQSLLLPVSGGGNVVAVIYADNGEMERWISDLSPLDAALARFGPSFETELLIGEAARTLADDRIAPATARGAGSLAAGS